jgi:hypothetical protein
MALEPSKHVNGRMWPPGVSGNPNGRPVGSRTVFSQSFLKDLASVWAERGRAAMEKTAIDQPGVFFATCARLIGPEVKLTIEQTLPGNLSMEDWQVMREIVAAVRQAIPDAAGAPPGAVLEHVLGALGCEGSQLSEKRVVLRQSPDLPDNLLREMRIKPQQRGAA